MHRATLAHDSNPPLMQQEPQPRLEAAASLKPRPRFSVFRQDSFILCCAALVSVVLSFVVAAAFHAWCSGQGGNSFTGEDFD